MYRCSSYLLTIVFVSGLSLLASSQSKEVLQSKKAQIQKEIQLTNKLIKKAKKEKNQSINILSTLNKQIESRGEIVKTLDLEIKMTIVQIDNLKAEIKETKQSIKDQQNLLDTLKKEYALMIRHAYHNRNSYDRLAFIFSAQSYNQAFKRIRYLQEYSQFRQKQVKEIKEVERQLSEELLSLKRQKVLLTVAKNKRNAMLGESQIEINLLTQEKQSQNTFLSSLRKKEKKLKKDLSNQQQLAKTLDDKIKKIIAEEIRKAKEKANVGGGVTLSLTPEEQQLADNFSSNKGKLPWPVERGVIIERFGIQPHPVLRGIETLNNGVKITTEEGSFVRAIFEGNVSRIIDIPGSGKAVIISHGDYFTVYSNLIEVFVKRGQTVGLKEDIARVFTKSSNKESITELQIWNGSEKLDPSSWLYKAY
ncbi:MAG: peptidoglycan DD-metalloendopeptidase family protein [Flavobacteriales bacterium]|nr:peptidoglycan DD-metalloendopeptidase family protein [Flavobacteriales bacterium]